MRRADTGDAAFVPVVGTAKAYPDGACIVPVDRHGHTAQIVPGSRSASLRAAVTADALAVLEPTWTAGAPARLLP
ncbi:hypothetical protein [Dactylosporangium sp. NPDC005555]|uniref:hypothetical protein n=1 Tax=Dactylosporangium sp. NPDC005555 TaxID=3154889 RepID=UPI0033BC7C6C